jgi:hypothetical protein
MLSVYQHWDPLEVCAVGRSYPPEFYSYIKNPKVRSVMERISIETEEDYQKLICLLESFNVTVLRNDISDNNEDHFWAGHYSPPPMTPRDHTIMIGETFFMPGENYGLGWFPFDYLGVFADELNLIEQKKLTIDEKEKVSKSIQEKLQIFPEYERKSVFNQLKQSIRSINHNPLRTFPNNKKFNTFSSIEKFIKQSGNKIVYDKYINAATTTRVGKDLYFGTVIKDEKEESVVNHIESVKEYLPSYVRFHIVNPDTHSDSNFVPVKPGLIISLERDINYQKTFPDWEVVYLKDQSWNMVEPFLKLKQKNKGKWWVPGEESNDDFTDFVETWLKDWVLYVEETVFDVNMLVIDESNVVCNNYNKDVFNAFERHGITPHLVNFRHRYFWDGGLHCITSDLSRRGILQDYFPERNKNDYF